MSEEGDVELPPFAEVKRYLQVFLEFMAELPEDVREKDADGIKRVHAAKTHKETKDALTWVFDVMIESKPGVDVINFLNRRGDITVLKRSPITSDSHSGSVWLSEVGIRNLTIPDLA
jgi:hypothetical protein